MRQYSAGEPMERLAIDVLGPLPTSEAGNKFILVVMDYFTKWPEAYPLPDQGAVTVARVLVQELVCRFGVPLRLHSDQGRNFEAEVFSEMCNLLGIKKTRTTPLHPQSDGMVERYNRTLKTQLTLFVDDHQRDWDCYVPLLLMAYRSAVHESTRCTPAKLVFGRELRLPVDLVYGRPPEEQQRPVTEFVQNLVNVTEEVHKFARANLRMASDHMKQYHDVEADGVQFDPGDLVWLYNPRRKKGISPKLTSPWQGPYRVLKRINDLVYRVQMTPKGKPKVVHHNRLWKYRGNLATEPMTESVPDNSARSSRGSSPETPQGQAATRYELRRSTRQRNPPHRFGDEGM